MELLLELTTRNYDQEFIDNWYLKLKKFILMKDKVKFCGKTMKKQQNLSTKDKLN